MMPEKTTPNHVFILIGTVMVTTLFLTGGGGCRSKESHPLTITFNERTDLQPEGTEHVGMLPIQNDCGRYFCTELSQDVELELNACKDCEGAQWAIRNPEGNIQLEGKGKRLTYSTVAPGTWAVEVHADGQKVTYLFIVDDGSWTEGSSGIETPPKDETPTPDKPYKPRLPPVSSPINKIETEETPVSKPSHPTPIRTDGLTLQLNGNQATISGLADGGYAIAYDIDGKSLKQDVKVSKGVARWPLKLERTKKQIVTINNLERKADGQYVEVMIREIFGEDKSMSSSKLAPPANEASVTPNSTQSATAPPAKYVGKETKVGTTLQGAWTDCKGKWVSESEIKVEAKAMCKMIYGLIYLDQAGELHITLKRQDGSSRNVIRKYSQGLNQVTFLDVYPEFEAGETATLSLACKGCRMADVSTCNTAPGKENLVRLTPAQGVITLVDLKIRY